MVIKHKICVSKTNLAPMLQSAPTSDGKTMVFKPQGIQPMITAAGYTASGNIPSQRIPRHISKSVVGMTANRKTEKIAAFEFGNRLFSGRDARTIPVNIMLKGPTQPDARVNA